MLKFLSKFDLILTLSTLLLLALGLTILSSVAPDLMVTQIIAFIIGLISFIFISQTNYQIWYQLNKPLYVVIIILLILPFLFGIASGGALRWLQIGPISIQPSEIIRPFLMIILAGVLAASKKTSFLNILKSALILGIPAYIIFRQPDLGLTLTLAVGWLGILITKGLSVKQIITGLLIVGLVIPLGWNYGLQNYQRNRVLTFLNPGTDPLNTGYHVLQSQIAVGSGQLLGRGLGRGTQSHLKFLPERHTDFVFASLAEELGLAGSLLVLLLYAVLFSRIIYAMQIASEYMGRLIISGLLAILLFQTLVNIGMNVGLLPVTGVTLPLLSYGGSSLIATFITLGIINNILIQSSMQKSLHIR